MGGGGRGEQLRAAGLPGQHEFGGLGGDRQPSTQPSRFVVVVDEIVLAVDDLDATDAEADDFSGAPTGVPQDLVDGAVHVLQVGGGERPGPAGRAEQVEPVVELADHRFGEGLAQFVLVGFGPDPVPVGRAERVGHRGHQPAAAAVFDDLAELVEQQIAVRRRVQGAVGAALPGDGVDDPGEVAGTQGCRVDPPGGGQGLGRGLAGAQRLPEPLQVGPGGPGPVLHDFPQPRQLDGPEVDHPVGGPPRPRSVGVQVK